MSARLVRPPMSTDEMLARLRRDGPPRTAAALAPIFDTSPPRSPGDRPERS
jgi:hypothetical protein